jgi:hypothetical protein
MGFSQDLPNINLPSIASHVALRIAQMSTLVPLKSIHLNSTKVPVKFHYYSQVTREERGLKQSFICHWAFFLVDERLLKIRFSLAFGHDLFTSLPP